MKKFMSLLAAGTIAVSLTAATAVGMSPNAKGSGECAENTGREKAVCLSRLHAPGIKKHAIMVKKAAKETWSNRHGVNATRVTKRTLKQTVRALWKVTTRQQNSAGSKSSAATGRGKITICHKGKTITIAAPAWKAHKKHGDARGACGTASSSRSSTVASSSAGSSASTSSTASSVAASSAATSSTGSSASMSSTASSVASSSAATSSASSGN